MSMLGLRDLFLIAPTPNLHQQSQPISAEHHSNLPMATSAALSVGLGIFPLLTATPCVPQSNGVEECGNSSNPNQWNFKICPEVNSARKGMIDAEDENNKQLGDGDENGEFRVCQDCGNRAKKDCNFMRCRTCCKGRGYDCTTHVKSTWVPASRRRERQMMAVPGGGSSGAAEVGGASSGSPSGAKRPRPFGLLPNPATTSHSSTSNAATPRSLDTSSCHQDASFKQSLPGKVRAPAVFRCQRLSAIGNGEDEFAYLATVHIRGHVFKGYLYDHGADVKASELNLENNSNGKNKECSSPMAAPTNPFPASASGS
ncbi:hypothetical protein L6164_023148 [Bauhinia variegata]|uniref:Uncharacterized protein n=1 Tax=Bauhinia variegata TaxID=167791 RepID=A0ACB9MKH6_BAUVA|nr:hypothetical protein L6164_023148 [Bauhinia variegata]